MVSINDDDDDDDAEHTLTPTCELTCPTSGRVSESMVAKLSGAQAQKRSCWRRPVRPMNDERWRQWALHQSFECTKSF